MFWMRLLLYLDALRFLGTMLVILKVMMKESAIFFLLLALICIGFLQAFIGLDQIDNNDFITSFIIQAMANSVYVKEFFSSDFQKWRNGVSTLSMHRHTGFTLLGNLFSSPSMLTESKQYAKSRLWWLW